MIHLYSLPGMHILYTS